MPSTKLKEFLDQENVKYETLTHEPAYTAQEVAASAHVSGKDFAKTVVLELDGRLAMAVLPANQNISVTDLRETLGVSRARFATENEFERNFPDCETGAMPPFGNLYGMEVYVAAPLAEDEEIAFNAGSHTELIRMPYREYERLVRPRIANFTT